LQLVVFGEQNVASGRWMASLKQVLGTWEEQGLTHHMKQVCTGVTGHAEMVKVTFDESVVSYQRLLEEFLDDA
jgi:peptide methionine sulfoxide reductase MsrA